MQKQFATDTYNSHHHHHHSTSLSTSTPMFNNGQTSYLYHHQQATPFIYNNNNQLLSNNQLNSINLYFPPQTSAVCSNVGLQQCQLITPVSSNKTYNKSSVMSGEELQRLELKREKNRRAAAKCRFIRKQRQESLEREVERLEKTNAGLEALKGNVEKEKLLFQQVLENHIPECRITEGSRRRNLLQNGGEEE